MSDDFYPFVDSGDPAPDNAHLNGIHEDGAAQASQANAQEAAMANYAARIAVYDDMISTPRVIVIEPKDVRTYLEETTNTVYRCMKEQGGSISLMVIREIVENFIHAHFAEPIISILDGGNTIRFADQGPGIEDKERAFDFGVTSANRGMKRYIRGTGAGFPMVQQYLEAAGGAVSIEDNMGSGTVVTVSLDPARVREIERNGGRGAAVRPETEHEPAMPASATGGYQQLMQSSPQQQTWQQPYAQQAPQAAYMQQQTANQQLMGAQAYPQQIQQAWGTQQWASPQYAPQAEAGAPANAGAQQVQPQEGMTALEQVPPSGPQPMPQQQAYPSATYPQQTQPAPQEGWQQLPPQGMYAPAYAQPAAYGYPQQPVQNGYQPWLMGYQQQGQMYPGFQQPAAQMMYPYQTEQPTSPRGASIRVSERGELALGYLASNATGGPTDFKDAFGDSLSTWSRELAELAKKGLVIKEGQKYHLTEVGLNRMNHPQQ